MSDGEELSDEQEDRKEAFAHQFERNTLDNANNNTAEGELSYEEYMKQHQV
jgi:hypothetical protein